MGLDYKWAILASLLTAAVLAPATATAVVVAGGGSKKTDCMSVFEAPGANKPAPPRTPKHVDCVDGDPTCDADGERNARCAFDLQICLNSTALPACGPGETSSVDVDHAQDDGDPKFDPDFQALQNRVDALGFPDDFFDDCTTLASINVPLRAKRNNKFKKAKKRLKVTALGFVSGKDKKDKDRMKFTCRPEGDAVYAPTDLYAGTFDRIAQQVFVPSCALSACHDSETAAGSMILLAGAAYSQLVGVVPANAIAANDGLLRVTAGDPDLSFLYRKILPDLEAGWGDAMPQTGAPVDAELEEIIRLWILGDELLGPAPETGWVEGTDQ